jgi:hypothetical protein
MLVPNFLPTATAPNGIHVSAELRINAGQLRSYGISWAADCMERAAKHIDALEDIDFKRQAAAEQPHVAGRED